MAMAEDVTRRGLLAATGAAGAAATAGCFSRLRSRVAYSPMRQLELSVTCVPADRDPSATAIARALRDNLDAVGVDVTLELTSEEQLLRDALLNHEFDLLVTRVPGHQEPDELRTLLHSRFAQEEGWQNPGGYASRSLDRLLERQRRPGTGSRGDQLAAVQRQLLHEAPFVTVATPTHVGAFAADLRIRGAADPDDGLTYLLADRDDPSFERLRLALLHAYPTVNRNLLSVEFRTRDRVLGLLYDQPVRRIQGQYVPWLAESISIGDDGALRVDIRPDLSWHDGESLTAADVAFTYRFLRDTTLGTTDSPVPAPRYRTQSSLVEDVAVVDDRTVELDLLPARRSVAYHALTVPILPAHQWRERSELQRQYLTSAIVENVEEPVGSGPLAFESASVEDSLTLERFDDHFLRTADDLPDALEAFRGGPAYEGIDATAAPNVSAAINSVEQGEVDLIDGAIPTEAVQLGREREGVRLVERPSDDYYAIWIDARNTPLSNYAFRTALARLIDREHLVETAFDDMATPTETPLHATGYVPEGLAWDGTSEAGPFPGEDGELDVEAARDLFRDAGFRFHDGELLARQ